MERLKNSTHFTRFSREELKGDLKVIGIYFLLTFPLYLLEGTSLEGFVDNAIFYLLSLFLLTVNILVLLYFFIPQIFLKKRYLLFFLGFIAFQILFNITAHLLQRIFFEPAHPGKFWQLLIPATFQNLQVLGFLLAILLGKKYFTIQNQMLKVEKEKKESQLRQLKMQVDPHFLFNNLNALDDLIDRDKDRAKKYLYRLSKLYRYSLVNMEQDVVPLEQEWNFTDDYIYLIEERFGKSYQFDKINQLNGMEGYLIPPAALQGLIENVVKHNEGSIGRPLKVEIKVDENGISVNHLKRLKSNGVKSLGIGLKNLKARYELLSNDEIKITNTDEYKVVLPLIKQVQ